MIVFILGRTGSGKSTTARFLVEIAQSMKWSVKTFNDYPFLRKMYEIDNQQRFRSTDYDGFEVLDLSVYGLAIQKLARQLQTYHPKNDQTLITVEFTSDNYRDALRFFDEALLRDARFLFLNVDLPTCLERINRRVLRGTTKDDYYVIENVLLSHYPSPYMPLCIGKEKAQFLSNMASIDELRDKVYALAPGLLEQTQRGQEPKFASHTAKWFSTIENTFKLIWRHSLPRPKIVAPVNSPDVYMQENMEISEIALSKEMVNSHS